MSGGMYIFCTENTIFDIAKDSIIVTEPKSVKLLCNYVFRIDSVIDSSSETWMFYIKLALR